MDQTSLKEAFPGGFDFYHLGAIQASEPKQILIESADFSESSFLYGIQLKGDRDGIFVFRFDGLMDPEVCREISNVLASRFSSNLAKIMQIDCTISSPKQISDQRLKSIDLSNEYPLVISKRYFHIHEQKSYPVQMTLKMTETTEEIHA